MNQLVAADQTSTREIGMAVGAGGSSIAPQNLGEVVRFAEVMCRADIALPQHLRGNAGACMAVAMQALEWQMSPFAVASKSYAVGGRIAYEAQLIAAVVNTRSGIKGRLRYEFKGEGADLSCRVTGILDGEECEYETPPFSAILVKNSPLWKSDPRQQLGYFAARSWARRHCPEVILGVYDRDEMEHQGPTNAKDVTPTVMTRLTAPENGQPASPAREGFDAGHVLRETSALSGGAGIDQQPTIHEPSDGDLTSDDEGSGLASPSGEAAADQSEPASAAEEAGEPVVAADQSTAPASVLSSTDREFLVRVFKTMKAAVGPEANVFKRQALVFSDEIGGKSELVMAKAKTIRERLQECCGENPAKGTVEVGRYLAGVIGVDERELAG
jgi:hypothetical protein